MTIPSPQVSDAVSASPTAGIAQIRLAQALRLQKGAKSSAMIVMGVIIYVCIILIASGAAWNALIWFALTTPLVGLTLVYARFAVGGSITKTNYKRYLRGHVLVTILTGLVWSGFSIYHTDYDSFVSLFIVGSIVCSITAGGMFPGSDYRPAYIALAICTLLPVSIFWVLTAPAAIRYFALGLLLFFLFGLYSSARAEINSRDGIIARTQQELTQATLERMRVVREGYVEKSRFLAATSHDLSQPLHAQGYFLDALGYCLDRPDQRELLRKIRASWSAQKDMLDDLVRVMRLDGGVLQPKPERVDLAALLRQLCREYQAGQDTRGITIEHNLEALSLETDPTFLRRIVGNILSNAVKFSPQNGVVSVSLKHTETGAQVCVRDHGPGIPEAARDALFNAYTQANADIEHPDGSGLGLSIVRRLATDIGAHVQLLTPNQGPGLFVTIDIPPFEKTAETPRPIPSLVVIIDDEVDIRESMMAALSNWGIQAIAAATGEEAASLLRLMGQSPEFLIVDYRLEGDLRGGAVIKDLRAQFGADIPAAIMTGDVSQVRAGPHIEVVPKPVSPVTLRRLVGRSNQPE